MKLVWNHCHNYTFYFKHLTAVFGDVSTIVLNVILKFVVGRAGKNEGTGQPLK
jgi:hypothetical protein